MNFMGFEIILKNTRLRNLTIYAFYTRKRVSILGPLVPFQAPRGPWALYGRNRYAARVKRKKNHYHLLYPSTRAQNVLLIELAAYQRYRRCKTLKKTIQNIKIQRVVVVVVVEVVNAACRNRNLQKNSIKERQNRLVGIITLERNRRQRIN